MVNDSKKYGVMRRLMTSDGDVRVGQEYIYYEDAMACDEDLGLIRDSIWDLKLPPCPDCGGQAVWAEAGLVPGARECTKCGSRFTIENWEQSERLESLARKWAKKRSKIPEDKILQLDSEKAKDIGLPVMSALLDLQSRLGNANGPISPSEMIAELTPILQLARGEAQRRAMQLGAEIAIPGIVMIPMGDVL